MKRRIVRPKFFLLSMFPLYLFVYFMYNAAPVERNAVETKAHSTAALKIEEASGYPQEEPQAASAKSSTEAMLYRGSLLFNLLLSQGEMEDVSFSRELDPLHADKSRQGKVSEDPYLDGSSPARGANR